MQSCTTYTHRSTTLHATNWRARRTIALLMAGCLMFAPTPRMIQADDAPISNASTTKGAPTERGLTGLVTFEYVGPRLRVKAQRDVDAPLLVRLAPTSKSNQYQARFIGNVPGQFDLRQWFEHADGSMAEDLPELPIEIVSTLPNDHRSDLFAAVDYQTTLRSGYRLGLYLAVAAWLAVPLLVIVRRLLNKPPEVVEATVPPPPTLLEQLRPLVQSAANRQLSVAEQARLELLLLHYWRERAHLPSLSMAQAIGRLRRHPEAGPVVIAIERWLHNDNTQRGAQLTSRDEQHSPDEILQLLQQVVP